MNGNWVPLVVDEILQDTGLAFLCLIEGEEHWVPTSQIDQPGNYEVGEMDCELYVTRWFAEKEGLA